MGYIWNLVEGDIDHLGSLFSDLSKISEKGVELQKKWVELEKLLRILTEMVCNSEKQDEGSVLDDEEKQHERSVLELKKHERIVLELWLEELQGAVFNMEDLHTEALRHMLDGQICEKMEDIRCSLESYVKQGDVLGLAGLRYNLECLVNLQGMHNPIKKLWDENVLKPGWFDEKRARMERSRRESARMERARRESALMERLRKCLDPTDYIYFVDKSKVFGMDCDKEEIIKLLLPDDASDKQLSVISIEGNGRIGKTTLARLVYNEQRVSHHFHLKAWVRVPDDFNGVTRSILKFLTLQDKDPEVQDSLYDYLNNLDNLNPDEVRLRLQQCLQGKRFLLVLDGAKRTPSSKRWEALRSVLKDAANGSCIIVTTRNKDIAPMMDAVSTYRMEPLSEEKCWSIFAKFAFGDQNPSSDTQLEVIGREIVQMCHGLPSSVRILGSLLRFKLQREEWEAIHKRLKPSSYSRENVNVIPADLIPPEQSKRCLAYCSIFSQDYEFVKDKLFLLWMAEGFVKRPADYGWREAIDEIFDKLKYFFQESSGIESSSLMRMNNLAAHVSTRYCYRLEDNHPSHIPLNTRYLSLVGGKYENSVIFEAIGRTKRLRTFLALDHESRHLRATELQNLLSKLQFLRVLSLSHYHITEIPDSIGNLKPLRYIDLSHTAIKRLPESVCELYNLQSLILLNCQSLTKLPENTFKLVNLCYLEVSGSGLSEMPKGMLNLKNLRLLPCFIVGKESDSLLKEFCNMEFRGTLHISKLQNVICDDRDSTPLVAMSRLEELVLEWDDNTADPENATKVLARLIPNWSLKKLTINFYCGTDIANFFKRANFSSMVFLRLSNCKNCSALPRLKMQETLRVLIIECMDAVEEVGPDFSVEEVGPDFSVETSRRKNTEFKSLERLTFEGMSKWTNWVPLVEFPRLKQLCIRRCPKLRGNLPKLLPSVERVEISESQELVTALTTEESLKNLHYRDSIVSISSDGKETYFKSERATRSSSIIIEGEDIEKLKETEESEETDVEIQNPFEFPFLEEISSLPLPQRTAECSLLVAPGEVTEKLEETQKSGETKEETNVEIQTTSRTKWSKQEQKEYIEDPSQFPVLEVESTLPLPQRVAVLSSPVIKKSKEFSETLKAEGITPEQDESNEEDPSPSLFSEDKSSLPLTQGAGESSLPMSQTPKRRNEADVQTNTWSNQDGLQDLSFESIEVSEISELMDLPMRVHSLRIEGCDGLEFIPEGVMSSKLSLQDLYIINCCSLKSFPKDLPPTALKILYIRNCKKLNFPWTTEKKTHQDALLEYLCIGSSCDSLESISLDLFPNLKSLSIWDCANLKSLSTPVQKNLTSLEALEIRDCPKLVSFLEGRLCTMNLTSIWLSNCTKLDKLPELNTLDSLQSMFINNCPELGSLPEKGLPSSLSLLSITFCNKLKLKDECGLDGLDHLRRLEIECVNVGSFPEKFLPSNLSSLRISGLLDLKNLDKGFQQLTALQRLEISCCPNLQSLPEDGFPSSLSFLCIKECPLLTSKFHNKKGRDWSKIDHISCIEIDEEVIS